MAELRSTQTIGQCLQESLLPNIQTYANNMIHIRLYHGDYIDQVEKELIEKVKASCNNMRRQMKLRRTEFIKKEKEKELEEEINKGQKLE